MNLILAPYLITLFAAVFCLIFWFQPRVQRWVSVVSSLLVSLTAALLIQKVHTEGIQVTQMGEWVAPNGITFVADLFSSIMLFIASLLGAGVFIYSGSVLSKDHQLQGFYFLSNTLMLGVLASFSTGDLFNLYVCFELLLISSFMLLSLGKTRAQLEASLKYVAINVFSSVCFLVGVGLLYGHAGTLNMAHLSSLLAETGHQLSLGEKSGAALLLLAFSLKTGLFPLFFWLPSSYHTAPTSITALFAGLLTKVGAYVLIRVFTLVFPLVSHMWLKDTLYFMALLTMLIGVLGAVAQFSIKRILSVHIISQIGYIILGLAIFTPVSIAASIYYLIHNMVAKTNLFLVGGLVEAKLGSDDLGKTGGMLKSSTYLAVLFLLSALALAGLPPLSGFFAKLFLLRSSFQTQDYLSVFFALSVSVFTLFSMLKIWNYAFWKKLPKKSVERNVKMTGAWGVCTLAAVLLVLMGVFASPLYEITLKAGHQLYNSQDYIDAVMGGP